MPRGRSRSSSCCCIVAFVELPLALVVVIVRLLFLPIILFAQLASVTFQILATFVHSLRRTPPPASTQAPYRDWRLTERAIPAELRSAVLERDHSICRYCGRRAQTLHIDHVIPLNLGGKSTFDNLVCACSKCNLRKGGRTPQQAGMTLLPTRTLRR